MSVTQRESSHAAYTYVEQYVKPYTVMFTATVYRKMASSYVYMCTVMTLC